MITIRSTKRGDRLTLLVKNLQNLVVQNRKVGLYLLDCWEKRFETESDPNGVKWHPLAASTLRLKLAKGQGTNILVATGKMKKAARVVVSRDRITLTNNTPYLPFHQLGTKRMPSRPVTGLGAKERQDIVKIYQEI